METNSSIYKKEFTAEIINVSEKNNRFYIELDNTFFLSSDDQYFGDRGSISDIAVSTVIKKDGITLHELDKKPLKIHKVKCSIDLTYRFNFLQQYFGTLLLCEVLSDKFNVKINKSYVDKNKNYIDIDRLMLKNDLVTLNEIISNLINSSLEIKTFIPTKAEFKKLKLKTIDKKLGGKVQLASVNDDYTFRCDLPAFNRTSELQAFSLETTQKMDTGMRIQFSFGKKAIDNFSGSYNRIAELCTTLKCGEDELSSIITTLKDKGAGLQSENASLRTEVANYELQELIQSAETFGEISIIKLLHKDVDMKYIELLSSRLVKNDNIIVLFGIDNKDKTLMNFCCSKNLAKFNMNDLLKDAIILIDGNGGGNNFAAKGGGKSPNNLQPALDYAHKKILST